MIKKVALVAFAPVILLFYAPFLAPGYNISGSGELKLPSLGILATTFILAFITAAYYLAKRGSGLEFALLIAPSGWAPS